MSILDRPGLEGSPLADLHLIASELSIDGYRRLRKAELIDAILERQTGQPPQEGAEQDAEGAASTPEVEGVEPKVQGDEPKAEGVESEGEERPATRRRRGRRGGRSRGGAREEPVQTDLQAAEEKPDSGPQAAGDLAEGVVELLPNGSGFLRVVPPEPSDDDVYISAAQVKRCELVDGDRIAGPRRPPRRSERFASLVRIDTINGRPASELAEGPRFDDLPARFPTERLRLGSADPTVKAIEWLTPVGKGSRVTISGPARSGKTEALRRLANDLSRATEGGDGLQVLVALAGVRPEEISEWSAGPLQPTVAVGMASSDEAQVQAVERVVDQGRRLAARGGDVVVLIDTLDCLDPREAHRTLGAARNLVQGGSLTIIATAASPVGGETTVIALDERLASLGRFPALDLAASGSLRPELLVGDAGAEAIARTRAQAIGE